ncbi:MAG TPA: ABC transporter substrate-binding protein [Pseudomonadales bacterium]|nr:ABC transporter substrate-binding protein [Pseudomonadales bacterium]
MKQAMRSVLSIFVLWASLMSWAYAVAGQTPRQVVQESVDSLIKVIVDNKDVSKKDPAKFRVLVDQTVGQYVDFETIAKLVMGKAYKIATPEQRANFVKTFRTSLMDTYANSLASYDNQKITLLPEKKGEVQDKNASINMEIYSADGQKYPLTYTMQQGENGEWKLVNLVLNGVNLGLIFRNQFTESMQQNSNDIDKVIASWHASDAVNKEEAKQGKPKS